MKKLFMIIGCAVFALGLNSCAPAYVNQEPVYIEQNRPVNSENGRVWITGDWVWQSNRKEYVHKPGYWVRPRRGRYFAPGYWQSSSRGQHWIRGRWY